METKKCKDCWKIKSLEYFYKKWIANWKQQYRTSCIICYKNDLRVKRLSDSTYYLWKFYKIPSKQTLSDRKNSKLYYERNREKKLLKLKEKYNWLSDEEKKKLSEKNQIAKRERNMSKLLDKIKEKRLDY